MAVLHNTRVADSLKKVTQTVFPRKNLETGLKDAPLNSYFSPYIALSTYCKLLPPQLDDKQNLYFNASGTVTIAEFFDTLNALYRGYNSEVDRRTSLDNVSFDYDYFNEGYNRVVTTYANPIFNLKNLLVPRLLIIDFIPLCPPSELSYLIRLLPSSNAISS